MMSYSSTPDMDISFNEEAPSHFFNHQGELVERDFDLGRGEHFAALKRFFGRIVPDFYGSFEMSFRAYSATNYHDASGTD